MTFDCGVINYLLVAAVGLRGIVVTVRSAIANIVANRQHFVFPPLSDGANRAVAIRAKGRIAASQTSFG